MCSFQSTSMNRTANSEGVELATKRLKWGTLMEHIIFPKSKVFYPIAKQTKKYDYNSTNDQQTISDENLIYPRYQVQ
ncbi:unnamed protein product [Rotaria sp. Silwood2]|nr:unnamed protein product [Rotaria sp. Silwood2]